MGNGLQKNFPPDDRSPGKSLHWALSNRLHKLVKLLLRRGADPNAPDREGFTPLQRAIRRGFCHVDALERFFEVCDQLNRRVLVDARDGSGRTALHHALASMSRQRNVVELLLRRGADPNAADHRGWRPLHVARNSAIAWIFLDACRREAADRPVQIDARDGSGRMPLQSAVVDLDPHLARVLLNYGADLSNFDFPTSDDLAKKWLPRLKEGGQKVKMLLAYNFLVLYGILAERGYSMDLMTDLRIMKFFEDHGFLVKKSAASGDDEHWYDNEEFAREAKKTRLNSSLSLYDLVRLRPGDAARLVSRQEHCDISSLWRSRAPWNCLSDESREAGIAHVCETILRSGCAGTRPFMDPRRCELRRLMKEDLFYIWLTAAASILDRRRESLLIDFFVQMSAVIVCITLVYIFSLCNLEITRFVKPR
uniref:Ion transport domain-containing protein n=1 Tax=Trichogramma kaykai TaxID=54128 RepID=A0ABD2W6Z1_9HYME